MSYGWAQLASTKLHLYAAPQDIGLDAGAGAGLSTVSIASGKLWVE
jgi:hypothetical protein